MAQHRVVIVGAGVAGLASALALAGAGVEVTVLERGPAPGGKIRQLNVGGNAIDSGPTVFTMRWVFDELFAEAGLDFAGHVALQPLSVLARHAWDGRSRLDLFADEERSTDAIGAFAGTGEAARYRAFCRDTKRIYDLLEKPFLRAKRPSMAALLSSNGFRGLFELNGIKPFSSMAAALAQYFHDPRLRQLFGRYATYCGSSPYLAPATLMLVAHVERDGVWSIEGGMHSLAQALAHAATGLGATIRYQSEVRDVRVESGHVVGIALSSGERINADAVVLNADIAAVAGGLFGGWASRATPTIPPRARSLSAMTWSMVASTSGFPLSRHNVFFSRDYPAEFDAIFKRDALPREPTVYVCAQDRGDDAGTIEGEERLLVLVNAPANGDRHVYTTTEVERCAQTTFGVLERCGLTVHPHQMQATTPTDFNKLFPATGGALYGRSSHGWTASFQRPGARTKIPGLYLAGGSAHPGPGVPMAALSGRAAASCLLADLISRAPSRPMAMRGGMSTR